MRLPMFAVRSQINRSPRRLYRWHPELELLEDRNAPDNLLPNALPDVFSFNEDDILSVAAPGVLTNDTDGDNDPLTAVLVTGPATGQLTFNANGSFTYVPEENYHGTVTFTYKAFDGIDYSTPTTVTLTINPVNDAPFAADDAVAATEDTPITFTALDNDFDVEGDSFSIVGHTNPGHGTAVLNGNQTFTYTPQANYHGYDSFTYTVEDAHGAASSASVLLVIEPAADGPVALEDGIITDEDTAIIVDVLENDSDLDGGTLSIVGFTQAEHGIVTLNANDTMTYAPAANWHGLDKFTYTISESPGLENDTAEVWVLVEPVNDLPVTANDAVSTTEDVPIVIDPLLNDTDIDQDDDLSIIDVTEPEHGVLTFGDGGIITYTPHGDFNGVDSFTYTAWDGHDGGEDTALVVLSVIAADDAPIAYHDAYNFPAQQGPVPIWHTVPAAGLLANDIDYDYRDAGYDYTSLVVDVQNLDTSQLQGALLIHSDGSFDYQPPIGFWGWTSFDYRIKDAVSTSSYATAWLYVAPLAPILPPGDPPPVFAVDDEYFFGYKSEEAVDGDVSTNDASAITRYILTNPPKYGRLSPQSAAGFSIDGSFGYQPDTTFAGSVPGVRRTTNGYVDSTYLGYTGYAEDFRNAAALVKLQAVKADLDIDGMDEDQEDKWGGLVVKRLFDSPPPTPPSTFNEYPDNKPPRKKIVIQPIANWNGNVVLTYTSPTQAIWVFKSAEGGEADRIIFNGTANKFAMNLLPMTLYVEAPGYSNQMKDIELKAEAEGLAGSADTVKFTALHVDQPEVKFKGTVTATNESQPRYKQHTPDPKDDKLGLRRFLGLTPDGKPDVKELLWGWGFEVRARVHPDNFSYPAVHLRAANQGGGGGLRLERDVYARGGFWDAATGGFEATHSKDFTAPATIDTSDPKGNDTSDAEWRDDDPIGDNQIYDLDFPGQAFRLAPVPGYALNSRFRLRFNARSFATVKVDGYGDNYYVRAGKTTLFWVRFSVYQSRFPTGYSWVEIPETSTYHVPGDNQSGMGTTPVSWDLK